MKPCALCATDGLEAVFTLPNLPLTHHLRKSLDDHDPRFDLEFATCPNCGLLQLSNPIDARLVYEGADTYTTSFQKPRHLDDLITTAIARQAPGSVLDVGCNDGALMEALKAHGYPHVVGIEPNPGPHAIALCKALDVVRGYFNEVWAEALVDATGPYDAVYCRHVIEHVTDIRAFMRAVRTVLRDGGQLVLELPDCEEALRSGSPAILWEEHVSYFTAPLARHMLERYGFEIVDERRYAFGGGSLAFVCRKVAVPLFIPPLPSSGLYPTIFASRMRKQADSLASLVNTARYHGYQIAMYGAAPRSCMVANVSGIYDLLDVVLDDRADLWNRLCPGTNVRITHPGAVRLDDRVLVLLGVGCENEHRVIPRIHAVEPVFVSLLPPRDTLASIEAARRLIEGNDRKLAAE